MKIRALAAKKQSGTLEPLDFDLGAIGDEQVEIAVSHCGICHSDLSMLDNEWQMTAYPFVPGHEVVGTVVAAGPRVKARKVGDKVGLGWFSASCLSCAQCMRGDQNLCGSNEQTIVARHGGFADRVRCQWAWATPIPGAVDIAKAGPLLCGGVTVFNPIVQYGISPMDRVGVVGIGGLGHLALQFLNKWGCEVHAFTTSEAKAKEARTLGAHYTVNSSSDQDLARVKGRFDFILVTANANLNWAAYIDALAPRGRLHLVGVAPDPVAVHAFPLIVGQRSVSASPLGSPATTARMLEFCARHKINAVTETYPMAKANEALEHLRAGNARYRIVLANGD